MLDYATALHSFTFKDLLMYILCMLMALKSIRWSLIMPMKSMAELSTPVKLEFYLLTPTLQNA